MLDTGPVTSSVAKLQNFSNGKVYLFWGTGRYYYKIGDDIDDAIACKGSLWRERAVLWNKGVDFNCTTTVNWGSLGNATAGASSDEDGWYIQLDGCTDASGNPIGCADPNALYMAERNVTDPLATPIGAVFFTTTKPAANVCEFGGASHLWALDFDTGGQVKSSVLRGRAVMQVSTGSIEEVDLKTAFTEKGGRRTSAVQGVPPAGTPPGILVPPDPTNKFIHIYEK